MGTVPERHPDGNVRSRPTLLLISQDSTDDGLARHLVGDGFRVLTESTVELELYRCHAHAVDLVLVLRRLPRAGSAVGA